MFRVRSFDEISSTNDVVKRAIDQGEPEGFVARAACQTGGYGRQGRTWKSPHGGLYFSMLLRPSVPAAQLPTLPLVAGVAVRSALARLADPRFAENIKVKWPNDVILAGEPAVFGAAEAGGQGSVLVSATADSGLEPDSDFGSGFGPASPSVPSSRRPAFRKLCGISSEVYQGAVCVGIGVNVLKPAEDVADDRKGVPSEGVTTDQKSAPPEGAVIDRKNAPAYLADLIGGAATSAPDLLTDLFETILQEFEQRYCKWCDEGFPAFLEEFERHAALTGFRIDMVDRDGAALASGTVEGVDEWGCLLVRSASGELQKVFSGEAHIR